MIEAHRTGPADLCRRFRVRRLDVFGSAARGDDFDPARSDVDLLVTYEPDAPRPTFEEYFGFENNSKPCSVGRSIW
jgi:predicted nucleotidyltransferase